MIDSLLVALEVAGRPASLIAVLAGCFLRVVVGVAARAGPITTISILPPLLEAVGLWSVAYVDAPCH
ncbi:hypothetical protein [Micromonospora sp. I033]